MVDINNLNRIRGILSARLGAEIPKFLNPAEPLTYNPKNSDFLTFSSLTGVSKSPLGWDYYAALKQVDPTATAEQLSNYYTGQTPIPGDKTLDTLVYEQRTPTKTTETTITGANSNLSNLTTAIPGANPDLNNPNAAVEASAKQNEITEQSFLNLTAQAQAEFKQTFDTKLPSSVNGITSEVVQNEKIPDIITKKIQEEANASINTQAKQYIKDRKIATKKINATNAIGQISSTALTTLGNVAGAKQELTDSSTTKAADAVYDNVADSVLNLGPWGKAIGGAMKITGAAGDIMQSLGGGTDQQTTMDKIMDSSFFSWNIGMLNGFAGKNTQDFGVDLNILARVGSSYGGTASDLNDAVAKADKKYGLFSSKARKKADEAIDNAKAALNLMGDISDTASDQRLAVLSMGELANIAYAIKTRGGYDLRYTYAAKHGGSLEWNPVIELEWEPQIELNWELPEFKEGGYIDIQEELEWIPEYKEGGKAKESDIPEIEETTQKNVIPEGALHKNRHHMEHAEGLTKKGIPVIDEDGELQAEIEHSEIIFTLEVTKKLEEYYEIFYSESTSNKEKEQAALEAGKLLVYLILENTEDRTGLIESCKKGGTLNFKKSTEDLIEEALEWIPTIMVTEEIVKEEEKPKNKSEKELMKEAIKEVIIELLTK